jgi:hypothetical protein
LAVCVLDLLSKPELLKRAKDEFAQRTQNHAYNAPIPQDLKPPIEEAKRQAEAVLARTKEFGE